MEFKRSFNTDLQNRLLEEPIFRDKLLPDIKKSKNAVFPAIRKNEISFYYKGGGIFTYTKDGFKTHYKYGIIPSSKITYITEAEIAAISLNNDFYSTYDNIKANCKLYGGIEAEHVSDFYGCNLFSSCDVILLDTEIAFGRDKSRIDILLYNIPQRSLAFCEAKDFSNKEIWAEQGKQPKVCEQINRYNQIISDPINTSQILQEYKSYIDCMNSVFKTDLPHPVKIHNEVGLIIFGFDSYQKEKINDLLINDGSLNGINNYFTGSTNSNAEDKILTLYNKITKD